MAARPNFPGIREKDVGLPSPADSTPDHDAVQETVAKLYGQGFRRSQIARALVDHLVPNGKHRPLEQRLSQARTKLRTWERNQKFRDKVYDMAVVAVDMDTPGILKGVSKKAKKGNVQAARFLLEVSGRHNPRGEAVIPNVVVAINGMPRPQNLQAVAAIPEISGEIPDQIPEDAEWDEV